MGMRHVWLRPESPAGAGDPCCPDDLVIARLAQLPELAL